jgi:TonB-linked SusC/RagA family outer membrane protein
MKKWFTLKLWKIMKLCAVQGMIALMTCGVCLAFDGYGQILEQKVTLQLHDVPLEKALKEITSITNVRFAYSKQSLNVSQTVTVDVAETPLGEVLLDLFSPQDVSFIVHENEASIVLKVKGEKTERASTNEIIVISGTVTSAEGTPMPGVNIIVKGTTTGTTTDTDGKYSLSVDENATLIFSFIGYTSWEVKVSSQTVVNVVLKEDIQKLGEVVVNAGYWSVSDKEKTGTIGKITAKEIEKQPVSNVLAAMQARVPGLEIIQQTGVPGGNFRVRIRGQNSIANGNDPLYIIDGVPFTSSTMAFNETSSGLYGNVAASGGTNPLNAINPADIESIEVLKDADATAIYGSRGSNGVILITTKKGVAGKTKFSMNLYTGAGRVSRQIDVMNTPQYIQMRTNALKNAGFWPLPEALHSFVPDVFVWDTTRHTNWQRELIGGTAMTTDAQIGMSGGEGNTQFSAGVGYHHETTVFPGSSSDKRLSGHMTLNNKALNDKLTTSFSVKYSLNNTDLIKNDLTAIALRLPPNAPPLYNENGDLNWDTGTWDASMPNPLSYLKMGYTSKTNNLLINGSTRYNIVKGLDAIVTAGYSNVTSNAVTTIPKSSLAPLLAAVSQNQSSFSQSTFHNWNVEPQLSWSSAAPFGKIDALIGTTFLEQIQDGVSEITSGYSHESLMKNIGAAGTRSVGTNYYSQYRYNALFGRINYNIKGKYFVNVTGRRDGSSRFGPGKQFANFGAIGAAWIFSEENFLKGNSLLSFGKIRGSIGVTGNDQLSNYQYLDTFAPLGNYEGTVTLNPARLANTEFAWESNRKTEIALEAGFFTDRITTSVGYYNNRASDQLVGYGLPPTTGFESVQGNLPAVVRNYGTEIELRSVNINGSDFKWITSVNVSIPHTKLVAFPDLENSPTYATQLVIGQPLSILKLYNHTGVDPQTGLYTMQDVNNDGTINALDRQSVRFIGTKFFGGLYNSFQYKTIQLDFLLQFNKQQRSNYLGVFDAPGIMSNQPAWIRDPWTKAGDHAAFQQFSILTPASNAYTNLKSSNESVSDASFLRLKNVSLSFNFPKSLASRLLLDNAKLFIQGQNLILVTRYKGLDPETGSQYLPPLRIISAGFNLTF